MTELTQVPIDHPTDALPRAKPLVSIVLTFLNGEKFLQQAIDSVLTQAFRSWELLLVNDGSTDSSTKLALQYQGLYPGQVSYLEHLGNDNRGISVSRNLGISHSKGKYIAFLDADDLWLPCKLAQQVAILETQAAVDMVYGFTEYWHSWTGSAQDQGRDHVPDYGVLPGLFAPATLLKLLQPLGEATAPSISDVLIRRELVERMGGFEEGFRGMYEDQAFLLKALLHGTTFVSGECWDKYRVHPDSSGAEERPKMSAAFCEWIESYLKQQGVEDSEVWRALQRAYDSCRPRQEELPDGGWLFRVAGTSEARLIISPDQRNTVRVAITKNETVTGSDIQLNLPHLKVEADHAYEVRFRARADNPRSLYVGVAHAKEPWTGLGLYRKVEVTQAWQSFHEAFVATADEDNARMHFDIGDSDASVELASVCLRLSAGPLTPGEVDFGNLRRVTPFSRMGGHDGGLPVDQYYTENFLLRNAADIRGRVLELKDDVHTRRLGATRVTRSDVLDATEENPRVTIVGDLSNASHIPSHSFDCIIVSQTLQLIFDVRGAVKTLHRVLKPGGVVLATIPGLAQSGDRDGINDAYWGFTPLSAQKVFNDVFRPGEVKIESFGNALSAVSLLHGLSAGDLTQQELDFAEPGYEVTITVRATKNERSGASMGMKKSGEDENE